MKKYRKKPVEIEAVLFTRDTFAEVLEFTNNAAMCSEGIVGDAIYFATRPLTKNCVRQIGCHYFCQ